MEGRHEGMQNRKRFNSSGCTRSQHHFWAANRWNCQLEKMQQLKADDGHVLYSRAENWKHCCFSHDQKHAENRLYGILQTVWKRHSVIHNINNYTDLNLKGLQPAAWFSVYMSSFSLALANLLFLLMPWKRRYWPSCFSSFILQCVFLTYFNM